MASAAASSVFLFLLILGHTAAQPPAGELPDYARVTPSMAVIIVVLIAALFLMGFFSIYIRNCSENQTTVGGSIRQLGRRAVAASRGLDHAVIETFPTMVYSAVKGLKIGKGALECAVCLNEFEDDETLRLIPKCDHVFHPECIDAWLESHTTCPVCRANLTPDEAASADTAAAALPIEPMAAPERQVSRAASDLEAGRVDDSAVLEPSEDRPAAVEVGPDVVWVDRVLNRNRTRGSRSGRPRKFPRSHSTGHSLVQPGENTDRFTLRLPADVRKQVMMNRGGLNRSSSMVVLPREGSTRRGYRTGGGEGSSRGKHLNYKRLEPLDATTEAAGKSDRWVFNRTSSFFARASSFLTRTSSSVRSPRVGANDGSVRSPRVARDQGGEESSSKPSGSDTTQLNRPPV